MSRSELGLRTRFGARAARSALLAVGLLVCGTACVENSIREGREPMDYEAAEIPPAPPASPGSIWSGGTQSSSFMFFDEKARNVGDLVTVVIVEQTQAQGDARTETESERTINAQLSSDVGFPASVNGTCAGACATRGCSRPPPR